VANGRSAAWVIGGAGLVIAGLISGAVSAGSQLSNPIESDGFPFSDFGFCLGLMIATVGLVVLVVSILRVARRQGRGVPNHEETIPERAEQT
jgi:hypothetical protein